MARMAFGNAGIYSKEVLVYRSFKGERRKIWMEWKFDSKQPIYTQLVDQMTVRIVTGVYAPGSKLSSVRDLAEEAGVNPNTMQRAHGRQVHHRKYGPDKACAQAARG